MKPIRPLDKEELKRAIEKAKANRFDEYGNYGENNPPLPMSKVGDKDYEC